MLQSQPYCLNSLLLLSWLSPLARCINEELLAEINKVVMQNKNLIKGQLYDENTRQEDLDANAVNCMYHLKGDPSNRYTKCAMGASCFQVYTTFHNTYRWHNEILHQGCWFDNFTTILNTNCTSNRCRINRSLHRNNYAYHGFCCCVQDLCNSYYMTRYNMKVLSTVKPSTRKRKKGLVNSTLILTAVTTVSTILFIIICLIATYYWRKKHPKKDNKSYASIQKTIFKENVFECSEYKPVLSYQALADILHGNLIHQGFRSAVRLGTFEGSTVAVKLVPPNAKIQWYNEKQIYEQIGSHPNIAQFVTADILHDGKCFEGIIVMEYYRNGSLLSFLRQHTLNIKEVFKLIYSLANGLSYLHGNNKKLNNGKGSQLNLAHLDLNSRNILVTSQGTCAICDFGHAVNLKRKPNQKVFQMVGSPRYMAPEVLNRSEIKFDWCLSLKQVDMYAFGLVLWEICRRCSRFYKGGIVPEFKLAYQAELGNHPSINIMKDYVCVQKKRPSADIPVLSNLSGQVTASLTRLMSKCWNDEGLSRLTSHSVMNELDTLHRSVFPNSSSLEETMQHAEPGEDFTDQCKRVIEESSSEDFIHDFSSGFEIRSACSV